MSVRLLFALLVCASTARAAPELVMRSKGSYAFVRVQEWIDKSPEGKRAKLEHVAEKRSDESAVIVALAETARERASVIAKAQHLDAVFAGEQLLYVGAHGDLLPAVLDEHATFKPTAQLASVDILRALTTCHEGTRAQASLAAAHRDAEHELKLAIQRGRSAYAATAQHKLDTAERDATMRIANVLYAEAVELARAHGVDILRTVEDESDVLYRAPGVDLRGLDLTAELTKLHDRRAP